MTDNEVVEMLTKIKSYYQNFVLNDSVAEAWIMIFKDYEYKPIMASLTKYVKTNEYSPVPASILKIYNEGKAKLDMAVGKNAEELIEVLSIMTLKNDVPSELKVFEEWIKKVPEYDRMVVSKKVIVKLKAFYMTDYRGQEFDLADWLKQLEKAGDLY